MTLVAPVETFTARTRSPFWTGIVSIYPACYLRLLVRIIPCRAGSWAETLKNYLLPSRGVQIFCANHSSQQSALTVDFQSFNHRIHLIILRGFNHEVILVVKLLWFAFGNNSWHHSPIADSEVVYGDIVIIGFFTH